MKLDNISNAIWLFDVKETLDSLRGGAQERLRYAHYEDVDTTAIAEGVKATIEEAIKKIERAIEAL